MTSDPAARFLAAYFLAGAVACVAGAWLAGRRARRRIPRNIAYLQTYRVRRAKDRRA